MNKGFMGKFFKDSSEGDEGIPSLPKGWEATLKQASDPGHGTRAYFHPRVQDELERFADRFTPARIGEEPSVEAVLGNLKRARDKLRRTLREATEELDKLRNQSASSEVAGPIDDHIRWLDHLKVRWDSLREALEPRSDYVRKLDEQVRRRWEEGNWSSVPHKVLVTCLGFGFVVLGLTMGCYGWGFSKAVSQEWQVDTGGALETLWQALGRSSVLLLLLLTVGIIWLAYRWVVGSWVGSSALRLGEHIDGLADYATLHLPLADGDDLGRLPQPPDEPRAVRRLGTPKWRVLLHWPTFVVALVGLTILLGSAFFLGQAKRPYEVLASLHGCERYEGFVAWRDLDEIVFFAKFPSIDGNVAVPRYGTLVLPRTQVLAMAKSSGGALACKGREEDVAETVGGKDALQALIQAIEDQSKELTAVEASLDRGVGSITEALGELGGSTQIGLTSLAGAVNRVGEGRTAESETIVASLRDVQDRLQVLNSDVSGSRESQTEVLKVLREQLSLLIGQATHQTYQSTRVNELRWISRVQLCLDTRNGLGKLWHTRSRSKRTDYIFTVLEKCFEGFEGLPEADGFTPSEQDLEEARKFVEGLMASLEGDPLSAQALDNGLREAGNAVSEALPEG